LTQVVAKEKGVALWGIVKETGVDDMGLLDFYEKFFRFPLYKDDKWLVYKAMGNRKITMKSLMAGLLKSRGRYKKKNIETTNLGEGWLQGGLLIFDKYGRLQFGSEEHFGHEINIEELRAAIQKCRLVE
jgi:AhpC/TSA antioxidant enzyme